MKDQYKDAFYKALGARIREIRGAKMTQEQLSNAANLSRTSIVNIECGRQKLLVYNLFQICKALRVQPSEFLAPLEPAVGTLPEINVFGAAAAWVKRSVKKAMKTNPPQ